MRAVNLLPDQHRRGPRTGGMANGAYIVVGVLAVLLVMALAYTLTANQANSRESQAAAAKQQADQAEARSKQLGAFGDFASIKSTRTAAVKQLETGRFDWERLMRELSAVLPEGSWFQSVNASVTGDPPSGSGGSAPAASTSSTAGPKLPAANLTGCTRHQHDVADLMVRLRKLYLVQDVELNSSDKGEGSGTPGVGDCGRYLKFQLSVTFSSAAPNGHEAPAGHDTVPARLGGGS
jgi:Tfp pilus assembly protein PilN